MMKDALEDLRVMLQIKQGTGKGYFKLKKKKILTIFCIFKQIFIVKT